MKKTGACTKANNKDYKRARLEPYEEEMQAQLSNNPSVTLKELQNWLEHEQNLSVSISTIYKFIRYKLGYRYEKTLVASEQQREDVTREDITRAREKWQAWQQTCDLSRLVFLDEAGLSMDMIRRYGRAL